MVLGIMANLRQGLKEPVPIIFVIADLVVKRGPKLDVEGMDVGCWFKNGADSVRRQLTKVAETE
jgi:hypothetical protein